MKLVVLMPDMAHKPFELISRDGALRMAVVDRQHVDQLPAAWDQPGIYILLDDVQPDGKWGAYVGKVASRGVRLRLQEQRLKPEPWRRAFAVRSDTGESFTSAEVGWLEGRVHELLQAAEHAIPRNAKTPGDPSLPSWDLSALEKTIDPIRRALRMLGHDASAAEEIFVAGPAGANASRITLAEVVEAGLLAAGTHLRSTNGIWPAKAHVSHDGKVDFAGVAYASPSAAASAVRDGGAVNGWEFWATDDGDRKTLAALRADLLEQQSSPAGASLPTGASG